MAPGRTVAPLDARNHGRVYRGEHLEALAFPLGGIGTGSISIGGRGDLRDFEIFNRPAKGLSFDYSFLALHARTEGSEHLARVLQGPIGRGEPIRDALGETLRKSGAGLPHFTGVTFTDAFPFAQLELDEPGFPLEVSLVAWNPFVPLDPEDSGLPAALFEVTLRNRSTERVAASLFASLENKLGYPETGGGRIEPFEMRGARGLALSTDRHRPDSPRYGTLALATPAPARRVTVQTHLARGAWYDSLQRYWDLLSVGRIDATTESAVRETGTDVGALRVQVGWLEPGESARVPIWIGWHSPNFEKYWASGPSDRTVGSSWTNHYATRFDDALDVVRYLARHEPRLRSASRQFTDALYGSTLPEPILDAVASQLSTLKTTTCLRLEDGTFYGWEGSAENRGSCEGSCTHVWNYAQSLAHLFPSLERTAREADYRFNQQPDGHMTFRLPLPLGRVPKPTFHAAADGQMGGVMRTYREWQQSGDLSWLREVWPRVRRAIEYAWLYWDRDRDGVMEGLQHNTYDIELYGPNSMITTMYLGALRAAEVMAVELGDDAFASEARRLFESGSAWVDAHLFDGDYYIQEVRPEARDQSSHPPHRVFVGAADDGDQYVGSAGYAGSGPHGAIGGRPVEDDAGGDPSYQYGTGCLSEQLVGQWHAWMLGLGDLLDRGHLRSAVEAIHQHNFKRPLGSHANAQRVFALGDEGGLLLGTWPRGGRPAFPMPYSDEVWTGVEYEVAALLIYLGLTREGVEVVEAARARYDGRRRNPWAEMECGNHYARAMSSYGLLLASAGYEYSAPAARLVFQPRFEADRFSALFSTGSGWGTISQEIRAGSLELTVDVLGGTVPLREIVLGHRLDHPAIALGARARRASAETSVDATRILLGTAVPRPGRPLVVSARLA